MGSYDSFLLVEWPLPWPKDIGDIAGFAELRSELAHAGCRLQALVPERGAPTRKVVYYQSTPDRPFRNYRRSQLEVDPAQAIDAAGLLLKGEGPEPEAIVGSEVLVCTHGSRDRCCGSMGTELALQLLANPAFLGDDIPVRRTSHTGGHRFAPTSMVFPEGTGWAFADSALLARVVRRQGSVAEVLNHYRGCAGLASPRIQAVERAVLGVVGWDLFDMERWGTEEINGTVNLYVDGREGLSSWSALVTQGRVLPMPDCGAPVTEVTKMQTEFVVGELHQIS
jgi:hypothetical protein